MLLRVLPDSWPEAQTEFWCAAFVSHLRAPPTKDLSREPVQPLYMVAESGGRVDESADALEAGEDAVAAWRARRRREPTWERIDRRATRHPRYRMVDVHVKMSPEGFAYMEAVRAKMNFGRGMSQGEFVERAFSVVRKKYEKATREYRKWWATECRVGDVGGR